MSTSSFADFEPEDAWSPYDDVRELIGNLVQRLVLLGVLLRSLDELSERQQLDEIAEGLKQWRRSRPREATDRDKQRAHDIARHLLVVRARLDDG